MNSHNYGQLIFDERSKNIQWSKDNIFNKLCWFKQLAYRRMQIDLFLSPCTKLKSNWIKELHIKPDTLNIIEKKDGNEP